MRIGIDVGGTNTDAVLLGYDDRVLAAAKSPTTPDITSGVTAAVRALDPPAESVTAVMIGTTHFLNALVEGARLTPVAAVRLGLPATAAVPPMADWPARQRAAVGGYGYLCHGGREFDGRPLSPLDPEELKRTAADIAARGLTSVAVSSVFSPVAETDERQAAEILRAELGEGVHFSLSHDLGRVGLLARENATIINASLRDLATVIVESLGKALAELSITAPFFLSQNDGTLMDVDFARTCPVATFASGPTNSMRGAALLSGVGDCAVIDVGGTTADIGMLTGGFPREAAGESEAAGIRVNFRIPDVLSLGIGGGSLVSRRGGTGPRSVGHLLTREALVFGGTRLTATDLAVAAGRADIGDSAHVAHLEPEFTERALERIAGRLAEGVDRMRTSAAALPVVAVGGGSVLMPEPLPGFADVRRPAHFGVANAVGAAIAQIGGEVDRVFRVPDGRRDSVLAEARDEALGRALDAGARPGSVRVVDIEEVPLAYLPGGATRIRVKAVGDLDLRRIGDITWCGAGATADA
ncbi:hydantoinase [Streptomyces longisporoflavus]|uniref:hydantoinase/oxoprolinase N-terminal domain-containing protein n=1 Tax=Streptomyces longisporoflavus TaxID=28044 RepID=UPI00167F18FF|nr:hydantoinase/oxoprolinase family protein [Streptomyces longisporoflavus]GGV56589.1 hydantoinase [Streptomyces longisporoflavus]